MKFIMKFKCPVCKSKIRYKRIDDGETILEFSKGEVNEIEKWSNGSTQVYCSKDESHTLSSELINEVIDFVQDNVIGFIIDDEGY